MKTNILLLTIYFCCIIPVVAKYTWVTGTDSEPKFYVDKENILCNQYGNCTAYVFIENHQLLLSEPIGLRTSEQMRKYGILGPMPKSEWPQINAKTVSEFYCLQHRFSSLSGTFYFRNGQEITVPQDRGVMPIYPNSSMAAMENIVCAKSVGFKPLR